MTTSAERFRAGARRTEVVLMEHHDGAYHAWRSRGLRHRIVVHVDAHHDLWWIPSTQAVSIADYLCSSIRDGMVSELWWVVPDAMWHVPQNRADLLGTVRRLLESYPEPRAPLHESRERATTTMLGCPFTIGPRASLRVFDEPVLLDIDVDYLTVGSPDSDAHGRTPLPGCWPDELIAHLQARCPRIELATIAYSVEGGFTPLAWKWLGDEIVMRLERGSGEVLAGFDHLRSGAVAAHRGELSVAEDAYRAAAAELPSLAAPWFLLSELYTDAGRIEAARAAYREAVEHDASYKTAYRTAGLQYFAERRYDEAERVHRRALQIDHDDAVSHLGVGKVAAVREDWIEAEERVRRAIALDATLIDAYRALGDVLAATGRDTEAVASWEESQRLSLRGHCPLKTTLTVDRQAWGMSDPEHFDVYIRIAKSLDTLGRVRDAVTAYRLGIAGGAGGTDARARLRLLLQQQSNSHVPCN